MTCYFDKINQSVRAYYRTLNREYKDEFITFIEQEQLIDPEIPIEQELGDTCNPNDCVCTAAWNNNNPFPIAHNASTPDTQKEAFIFYVLQYCYKNHKPPSLSDMSEGTQEDSDDPDFDPTEDTEMWNECVMQLLAHQKGNANNIIQQPVKPVKDMNHEIFEFERQCKGEFFIAKDMTDKMIMNCVEKFDTYKLNDDNAAFGYYKETKESVIMQINDKQTVFTTAKGDIVILNIDLHFENKTRDIMYLIAMENDHKYKTQVKWKIVDFMNAYQIKCMYNINNSKLPKSSRNSPHFQLHVQNALKYPPQNVPFDVIYGTDFKRLPMKNPNNKRKIRISEQYKLYKSIEERLRIAPNTNLQFNVRIPVQPSTSTTSNKVETVVQYYDEDTNEYNCGYVFLYGETKIICPMPKTQCKGDDMIATFVHEWNKQSTKTNINCNDIVECFKKHNINQSYLVAHTRKQFTDLLAKESGVKKSAGNALWKYLNSAANSLNFSKSGSWNDYMKEIETILSNVATRQTIIGQTKWHKVKIFNKHNQSGKTVTLCIEQSEFMALFNQFDRNAVKIVPIVVFDDQEKKRCINYVWIIPLEEFGDIGISFKDNDTMVVNGIHLDKEYLLKCHKLLPSHHACNCLEHFHSKIDILTIHYDNYDEGQLMNYQYKYKQYKGLIQQLINNPDSKRLHFEIQQILSSSKYQ